MLFGLESFKRGLDLSASRANYSTRILSDDSKLDWRTLFVLITFHAGRCIGQLGTNRRPEGALEELQQALTNGTSTWKPLQYAGE